MGSPFIGEIRMFGGNFAPVNWAFCNGQTLSIAQYTALFSLIGTTYGGDGVQTFNLPNLQSRVPVHQGNGPGGTYVIGQPAGAEAVILTPQQMPSHTHTLGAANTGETEVPTNSTIPALATSNQAGVAVYGPVPTNTNLNPNTIRNDGGGQPHSNIQPYLALNFIISLLGIFPPRS
jgi:microcystin-dependent protein